jgi:hypothetical protein
MSTTRTALNQTRAKHTDDAAMHQKEIARAEKRLGDIKDLRTRRAHLEKIVAHDAAAIRDDDKLAQEESTLSREVSMRRSLIADSAQKAEALDSQIENAGVAEAVELAKVATVKWENQSVAFSPLFEGFAAELKQFETGRVAVEAAIRACPEWAQVWLGKYYLQNLVDKFNSAVSNELSRLVGARGKSSGEFVAASEMIFSNAERAFATIGATAARGGEGRAMFRAIGGVNGLSGGLTVHDGDVICLPVDDAETKKLVASGALIAEEETN